MLLLYANGFMQSQNVIVKGYANFEIYNYAEAHFCVRKLAHYAIIKPQYMRKPMRGAPMRSMRADKEICVRKIAIACGNRKIPALVLAPKKQPVRTSGMTS